MKEREARVIKISVANIKFGESKYQKAHTGSAVCLPKKPPNIAYVPQEYQRHKSKKSVNQNINITNTSDETMLHDKAREPSRIRPAQMIRKPRPCPLREKHEDNHHRNPCMLRTRERSISINLNYETLRTEGSLMLAKDFAKELLTTDRLQELQDDLACDQDIIAPRKDSFVRKQQQGHRKNSFSSTDYIYTKKVSTARPSLHDYIRTFEDKQEELKMEFDLELLHYLINRQTEYNSLPFLSCYLDKKQKYINWTKRAVLIDWMIEVLTDYSGKRETLYLAVSMVDRFLCISPNFPVNKLQLVGIASLFIAYKLEEQVRPTARSFAETTGGKFSVEDLTDFEQQILKKLKWYVNPPNLNTWCNRVTSQWDAYLTKDPSQAPNNMHQTMLFKNSDEKVEVSIIQSYYNYRWLVQLLDFALLDSHTLQYKSRTLVASFMYVILGIRTHLFKLNDVLQNFPRSSKYLFDHSIWLNDLFNEFLQFSFGMALSDLLPTIQYCATYLILPLSFELPEKVKNSDQQIIYEQFCSYQTRNKANILYLQKRNRSFD